MSRNRCPLPAVFLFRHQEVGELTILKIDGELLHLAELITDLSSYFTAPQVGCLLMLLLGAMLLAQLVSLRAAVLLLLGLRSVLLSGLLRPLLSDERIAEAECANRSSR